MAEGDSSGTFFREGHPARWVFAGIRKVITCDRETPEDGAEVTWSQFKLRGEEELRKLVAGEPVSLVYEE